MWMARVDVTYQQKHDRVVSEEVLRDMHLFNAVSIDMWLATVICRGHIL